jgi:hypothetical protein
MTSRHGTLAPVLVTVRPLPAILLTLLLAAAPARAAESFDVVVYGGGPEAVAAAVAAAREGSRVALVVPDPNVGALFTRSWLNTLDMSYDQRGQLLTRGIFREFWERVGWESSFDVGRAQRALDGLLAAERNVTVNLNAPLWQVDVDGDRATAIVAAGRTYRAPFFVDASEDMDLAAPAGAGWTYGMEDAGLPGRAMAATLIFRMRGVNWSQLEADARAGRTDAVVRGTSAHGFLRATNRYVPSRVDFHLRGLNVGRQADGTVLINALLIYNYDPFEREAAARLLELAAHEARRASEHLAATIPAFANARFDGVAPAPYVRESRHLIGLYRVTTADVILNRDFPDRIALGSYPMDVQPSLPHQTGLVLGIPAAFAVPFRALVPTTLANVLVASRSASYDSGAAASARTAPLATALGQAAGTAAALAAPGQDLRQLALDQGFVSRLQSTLVRRGARLDPAPGPGRAGEHPAVSSATHLASLLAFGVDYGMRGDQRLDAAAPYRHFFLTLALYLDNQAARVIDVTPARSILRQRSLDNAGLLNAAMPESVAFEWLREAEANLGPILDEAALAGGGHRAPDQLDPWMQDLYSRFRGGRPQGELTRGALAALVDMVLVRRVVDPATARGN